jgi:hypothetical protein
MVHNRRQFLALPQTAEDPTPVTWIVMGSGSRLTVTAITVPGFNLGGGFAPTVLRQRFADVIAFLKSSTYIPADIAFISARGNRFTAAGGFAFSSSFHVIQSCFFDRTVLPRIPRRNGGMCPKTMFSVFTLLGAGSSLRGRPEMR